MSDEGENVNLRGSNPLRKRVKENRKTLTKCTKTSIEKSDLARRESLFRKEQLVPGEALPTKITGLSSSHPNYLRDPMIK